MTSTRAATLCFGCVIRDSRCQRISRRTVESDTSSPANRVRGRRCRAVPSFVPTLFTHARQEPGGRLRASAVLRASVSMRDPSSRGLRFVARIDRCVAAHRGRDPRVDALRD